MGEEFFDIDAFLETPKWENKPRSVLKDIERGMKIISGQYLLDMPEEIPDKRYRLSLRPSEN